VGKPLSGYGQQFPRLYDLWQFPRLAAGAELSTTNERTTLSMEMRTQQAVR